jgi:uncharacterized protein (DUF1015 family)
MNTAADQSNPVAPGPVSSSVPRPSGLVLAPFRALRFDPAVAGDLSLLTSPPYDVVDAGAVAELEALSGRNVVRLILPREGPAGEDRYARAAATLRTWREDGALRPDPEPALYVYEQAGPQHVQRGLLGALSLTPPEDGIVLPHENTMAGPVSDRLALYTAVGADLEPIFLVYDGGGAASRAVARADERAPLLDVVLPDGLRHRVWALTEQAVLEQIAADLQPRTALIADGHHRYATYRQRQAEHHRRGDGAGPWDAGLCFLVDATTFGPQVAPLHRVVPGLPAPELARRAAAGWEVTRLGGSLADAVTTLGEAGSAGPAFLLVSGDEQELQLLHGADAAQLAAALPPERSAAWRGLDVSVLHGWVIPSLWELADEVDVVGYAHDVREAVDEARRSGGTAVLMNATPVEAVAAVARSGERMPRKSTLFTPKPRSGLVLRDHRDAG